MEVKDLVVAEVLVLFRALVIGAVPAIVMVLSTGSVMSVRTYAIIVGVLVVLANVAFAIAKLKDDGTIEQAIALEDSLSSTDEK